MLMGDSTVENNSLQYIWAEVCAMKATGSIMIIDPIQMTNRPVNEIMEK